MVINKLPSKQRFWEIVEYLVEAAPMIRTDIACQDLKLSPEELRSYLLFLDTTKSFQIPVGPSGEGSAFIDFQSTDQRNTELNKFIATMRKAIQSKNIVSIKTTEFTREYFPQRVVFLDGAFSFIGEEITNKEIDVINIENCIAVEMSAEVGEPHFARMEIDDYMSSVRLIAETSERLILKIHSLGHFDLNVDYQYFENLCAFSNSQGDYIWGATVEANPKLFEWLYRLGQSVEILEPLDFKYEYFKFFDRQIKKAG